MSDLFAGVVWKCTAHGKVDCSECGPVPPPPAPDAKKCTVPIIWPRYRKMRPCGAPAVWFRADGEPRCKRHSKGRPT